MTAAATGAATFALGLLAGAVLMVSLGGASTVWRTISPPEDAGLPACSAEMEVAYEVIRFAQYSHVPWLQRALTQDGMADDEYLDRPIDADFQRWWIVQYGDVLQTISASCRPATDYPALTDLPNGWASYPPRSSAAEGRVR